MQLMVSKDTLLCIGYPYAVGVEKHSTSQHTRTGTLPARVYAFISQPEREIACLSACMTDICLCLSVHTTAYMIWDTRGSGDTRRVTASPQVHVPIASVHDERSLSPLLLLPNPSCLLLHYVSANFRVEY